MVKSVNIEDIIKGAIVRTADGALFSVYGTEHLPGYTVLFVNYPETPGRYMAVTIEAANGTQYNVR